ELFAGIDAQLWEDVHGDPVRLLGSLSPERLAELAADDAFVARVRELGADLSTYLGDERWYQGEQRRRESEGAAALPGAIAYFSAELGITGGLPQYSGGLGIRSGYLLVSGFAMGGPSAGVGMT